MMTMAKCKGAKGHKGHLCVLAAEERFDEIKPLAAKPRFICFNCGRVAASNRNLCNPMSIEDK
jgi:hypothetical protein